MSEFITELDAEFTPHPGSSLDHQARAEAQTSPVGGSEAPVDSSFGVIQVRDEAPALGSATCVILTPASTVKLLLPQDPQRRSAVILAVDNDVYITSSKELAQAAQGSTASPIGFYLPAGIAVPVSNQSALWVASTTTASSSRVSVMVSKDE